VGFLIRLHPPCASTLIHPCHTTDKARARCCQLLATHASGAWRKQPAALHRLICARLHAEAVAIISGIISGIISAAPPTCPTLLGTRAGNPSLSATRSPSRSPHSSRLPLTAPPTPLRAAFTPHCATATGSPSVATTCGQPSSPAVIETRPVPAPSSRTEPIEAKEGRPSSCMGLQLPKTSLPGPLPAVPATAVSGRTPSREHIQRTSASPPSQRSPPVSIRRSSRHWRRSGR